MTRLTDLTIVPEQFTAGMFQQSLALDSFVQSGVAVVDPRVSAFLNSEVGGESMSMRFIKPLGEDESNVSSDNPSESSTPDDLSGDKETFVRHSRNNSWGSMDLTAELYGSDPLGAVQLGLGKYWLTQRQKIVLRSLAGVLADNVANDSGDMVNDISGETGADALINGSAFIDALLTLGDRMGGISAFGIHSIVYGTLLKNDLIEFVPDSQGQLTIPTYMGKRVVVDDGMTVDPTGGPGDVPLYTTALFGAGSIIYGMGSPKTPVEVERDPAAGNGGGQETIFSRVEMAVHPVGFSYSGTRTNGKAPTWAELATAGNWDRVYERKRVPMAFIQSLG